MNLPGSDLPDGEAPSPAELEFIARIRADRARARVLLRRVMLASTALMVVVAACVAVHTVRRVPPAANVGSPEPRLRAALPAGPLPASEPVADLPGSQRSPAIRVQPPRTGTEPVAKPAVLRGQGARGRSETRAPNAISRPRRARASGREVSVRAATATGPPANVRLQPLTEAP